MQNYEHKVHRFIYLNSLCVRKAPSLTVISDKNFELKFSFCTTDTLFKFL